MCIGAYVHAKIAAMGKKRLVLNLEEAHHKGLVDRARAAEMTVSNYVRKALGLPLERQGVKPNAPWSEKLAKRPAKAKRPARKG